MQSEESSMPSTMQTVTPGKMFIGGLSPETTRDRLKEHFGRFGDIIDCVVMTDQATGRTRGFGFVTYRDNRCCEQVLANRPHFIDGREVDPKMAVPREEMEHQAHTSSNHAAAGSVPGMEGSRPMLQSRKVFVGGLPSTATDEALLAFFSSFGDVEEAVVIHDKQTRVPRGFGFVTFVDEDTADNVVRIHFHDFQGKLVEVKRAEPKPADGSMQLRGPAGNRMRSQSTPIALRPRVLGPYHDSKTSPANSPTRIAPPYQRHARTSSDVDANAFAQDSAQPASALLQGRTRSFSARAYLGLPGAQQHHQQLPPIAADHQDYYGSNPALHHMYRQGGPQGYQPSHNPYSMRNRSRSAYEMSPPPWLEHAGQSGGHMNADRFNPYGGDAFFPGYGSWPSIEQQMQGLTLDGTRSQRSNTLPTLSATDSTSQSSATKIGNDSHSIPTGLLNDQDQQDAAVRATSRSGRDQHGRQQGEAHISPTRLHTYLMQQEFRASGYNPDDLLLAGIEQSRAAWDQPTSKPVVNTPPVAQKGDTNPGPSNGIPHSNGGQNHDYSLPESMAWPPF